MASSMPERSAATRRCEHLPGTISDCEWQKAAEHEADEVEYPRVDEGVCERREEAFAVADGEDHHLKRVNVYSVNGAASVRLPRLHVAARARGIERVAVLVRGGRAVPTRERVEVLPPRDVALAGARSHMALAVRVDDDLKVHAVQDAGADVDVVAHELCIGANDVGSDAASAHREAVLQDDADAPRRAVRSVGR
eukprot:2108434-Prymnesium_polylepis.2